MSTQRATDQKATRHFRTDRYYQQGGQWYFNTRENTTEGPFITRAAAEQYLKVYAQTVKLAIGMKDVTLQGEAGGHEKRTLQYDPFHGRFGRYESAA